VGVIFAAALANWRAPEAEGEAKRECRCSGHLGPLSDRRLIGYLCRRGVHDVRRSTHRRRHRFHLNARNGAGRGPRLANPSRKDSPFGEKTAEHRQGGAWRPPPAPRQGAASPPTRAASPAPPAHAQSG